MAMLMTPEHRLPTCGRQQFGKPQDEKLGRPLTAPRTLAQVQQFIALAPVMVS